MAVCMDNEGYNEMTGSPICTQELYATYKVVHGAYFNDRGSTILIYNNVTIS